MSGRHWVLIAGIFGLAIVLSVDTYSHSMYRAAKESAKITAAATVEAAKIQCQ